MKITEITGTITLADGSVSEFTLGTDGGWQQWGATTKRLGQTVDALEIMASCLMDNDLLSTYDDELEEEADGIGAPTTYLTAAVPEIGSLYPTNGIDLFEVTENDGDLFSQHLEWIEAGDFPLDEDETLDTEAQREILDNLAYDRGYSILWNEVLEEPAEYSTYRVERRDN